MQGDLPFPQLPGSGVSDDEVELGHVQGVFGVKGEVKLYLHNRESAVLDGRHDLVLVTPAGRRHRVRVTVRPGAGKRILGRIEGCDDRELAAALSRHVLAVAKDALPALADDEFYLWQLVGAEVRIAGRRAGEITDVQTTPGMDVLVVRAARDIHMVPCVKELVLSMDRDAGVVELHPDAIDAEEG